MAKPKLLKRTRQITLRMDAATHERFSAAFRQSRYKHLGEFAMLGAYLVMGYSHDEAVQQLDADIERELEVRRQQAASASKRNMEAAKRRRAIPA